MAVTLTTAKSSHAALKETASNLFQKVKQNVNVHDASHWSEQNARAALATKAECGYYYRIKTERWLRHKKGVETDKPWENMSRKAKKNWEPFTKTYNLPVDANRCLEIVNAALIAAGPSYKRATTNPETRFTLIAAMPKGYGGVTLYRDASPAEECTGVALVIVAGTGTNAALVTHFPCASSYVERLQDLT